MAFEFNTSVKKLTDKGSVVKEIAPEIFKVKYLFVYKDGTQRSHQVVCSRKTLPYGTSQKDFLLVTGMIGIYNNLVDLAKLLRESKHAVYTNVSIVTSKNADGSPLELLSVTAKQPMEIMTDELFEYVMFEVANVADWMERICFGEKDTY